MSETVKSSGDIAGNRTDSRPCPHGADFLAREGAARVGRYFIRWATRGGYSEEVSFQQQPQ